VLATQLFPQQNSEKFGEDNFRLSFAQKSTYIEALGATVFCGFFLISPETAV
jgi:hypothetical protein